MLRAILSKALPRLNLIFVVLSVLVVSGCSAGYESNPWRYDDTGPQARQAPSSLSKPYSAPYVVRSQPPQQATDPRTTSDIRVARALQREMAFEQNQPFAQKPPTTDKVKVGLLLPLTGEHSNLGKSLLNAAQMALFDIGQGQFEIVPRDTKGTVQGAQIAAQDAIASGAQMMLGPVFSGNVRAAKRVTERNNITMIAFTTDWTLAGGDTFVMGSLPFDQIERVINYASLNGVGSVGVLAPNTDYGRAVTAAYNSISQIRGIETVKIQNFSSDSKNIAPIVREFANYDERLETLNQEIRPLKTYIKENPTDERAVQDLFNLEQIGIKNARPFEAMLLPIGGDLARAVTNLASHFDMPPSQVRRLGTGLWDDPGLAAEPSLEGAWFAAPPPANRASFEKRYKAAYKNKPSRLASLAYDATALSAVLAQKGIQSTGYPAFTSNDIINPNGFSGIDGIFRFRRSGIVERGLAILEFQNGQTTIVDSAPTTFETFGYN